MDDAQPSIADGIERSLDPRYVSLQRLNGAICAAIFAAVSFVAMSVLWIGSGILFLGLLLLPAWMTVAGLMTWQLLRWPAIAYRHSAYRVDDRGIEIRRGVYWREIINVPRSRVQHTDVSQGPLERRYGLGTLVIHTAGTAHSEVTLGGLDHTLARRIRAHLLPGDEGDAV
jgi:membrane protein YdbS with pleckstrin-like domain